MGKKILILAAAVTAVGVGTGALLNSKKMRMQRMLKKVSRAMYVTGTMLRTLSCQTSE
jgi:hypothetical protein